MVDTVDNTAGHKISAVSGPGMTVRRVTIDCAAANKGSGDIDQLFDIVQGDYILAVMALVTTVEDSTLTIDVGVTGATADGFINGQNAENLGITGTHGAYTADGGVPWNAADTVDVLWNNAADTAVIEFTMFSIHM
jgi:hypothetical protein